MTSHPAIPRALSLALVLAACADLEVDDADQDPPNLPPAGLPAPAEDPPNLPPAELPAPAVQPGHLSGVVYETLSDGTTQPAGGAQLNIWVQFSTFGYHFGHPAVGADGQFDITNIPDGASLVLFAWKPGYWQPCAYTPSYSAAEGLSVGIELFSDATLLAGVPVPTHRSPVLSGTVRQNGQPVAGAEVEIEVIDSLVTAWTRTDSQGRYLSATWLVPSACTSARQRSGSTRTS